MNQPAEDSSRSTYWYCQIGNRELGPMLMSRLRQMGRKGEISSEDLVRKGSTGEWVAAGTVEGLSASVKKRPAAGTAQPARKGKTEERPAEDSPTGAFLSGLTWRVLDLYYAAGELVQNQFGVIRKVGSWVALVVVVLVLLRLGLSWNPFDSYFHADPVQVYNTVWTDLKQKRDAKAGDTEWREFSDKASGQLKPIIARLEKEASADNRRAQQLLWAGRDCLQKVLDDPGTKFAEREKQYEEHMRNVALLNQGEALYGGNSLRGPVPFVMRWSSADLTTTLFGAVMVVVDVGIVWWFVRGWRKKRTAS